MDNLRLGVRDQPGQNSKTPSLLKIQKLQLWWWVPVIPATQEAEVAVSRDCATALQPGDRARLHLKMKERKKKEGRKEGREGGRKIKM